MHTKGVEAQMSKKIIQSTDESTEQLSLERCNSELNNLSRTLIEKSSKVTELEQRLKRLEKRYKSNERLSHSLAECLATQVVAVDAVSDVVRRNFTNDAEVQEILRDAIKKYDKHKFRRFLSGFLGVLLWVGSVMAAACIGAFIYWLFAEN